MLAGCSQAQNPDATTGGVTGSDGGRVTIQYVDVSGSRSRDAFQPVIDELNDEHGSTIDLEFTELPYANMRSQLMTRVGGANAPDVAAIDQIWLGEFIDGEVLMPLDSVADDIEYDDHLPALRDPLNEGGHVYGIPISTDVRGMYWNRRAFEAAGLDPDVPPATWPELVDVAERLHDPPEVYGATYFVVGGRWTVSLFSAGGRVLSEDATEPRFHEQPGVEAAGFVDELYNERDVGPPEPVYRDGSQLAREFLSGQHVITVVEGSWLDFFWENLGNDAASMPDRFGFAATPHPPGGATATMSGGFAWGGFASTDHPEIVRDFLRIAAGRPFKRQLAVRTGDLPTRESLLDDEVVWESVLYPETVKSLLRQTRTRPIRNWSAVADALDPALQRVAFDRATPEDALEDAAEQVRSTLG